MGLERLRILRANTMRAKLIDVLQRGLMSKKYSRQMLNLDGSRRDFISYDLALGAIVSFAPDDVLVCVGWQWQYDMAWLKTVKAETRFKFVLLCHDILMLLWPTLYGSHRVNAFKKWIEEVMPLADLVIFTTRPRGPTPFTIVTLMELPFEVRGSSGRGSRNSRADLVQPDCHTE